MPSSVQLKHGARHQLAWLGLIIQPVGAGARSLSELHLRIYWHEREGCVDKVQNKSCFSWLPTNKELASHYLGLFTMPAVAGAGSMAYTSKWNEFLKLNVIVT